MPISKSKLSSSQSTINNTLRQKENEPISPINTLATIKRLPIARNPRKFVQTIYCVQRSASSQNRLYLSRKRICRLKHIRTRIFPNGFYGSSVKKTSKRYLPKNLDASTSSAISNASLVSSIVS